MPALIRKARPTSAWGGYDDGYTDGICTDLGYPVDRGPLANDIRTTLAGATGVAGTRPARIEHGQSPYGRPYACIYFENGLASLTSVFVPDNNAMDPAGASFTMEGWIKVASADLTTAMVVFSRGSGTTARYSVLTTTGGKLRFLVTQTTDVVDIASTTSIVADTWTKWSLTRITADKFYLHLGGVKENEAATVSLTAYGTGIVIGRNFHAGGDLAFRGRVAGVRWSTVARYSSANYTPETVPFTSDASTALLVDP